MKIEHPWFGRIEWVDDYVEKFYSIVCYISLWTKLSLQQAVSLKQTCLAAKKIRIPTAGF